MATISEVKAGLDDIATTIRTERRALVNAKVRIATAQNNLAAIPTIFADVIAEIDGYTPTGEFEALTQDEKAKLQTEFVALRNAAGMGVTALVGITEY